MSIKIKIVSVGKTKESWLDEALREYTKRLSGWAELEFVLVRDDEQLLSTLEKEKGICICLDPQGQQLASEQFAFFLQKKIEEGGARLSFVIGGPEGLPDKLRKEYPLLSLSKMTFTHQLARLTLAEQIYRGYCILNGLPYHK